MEHHQWLLIGHGPQPRQDRAVPPVSTRRIAQQQGHGGAVIGFTGQQAGGQVRWRQPLQIHPVEGLAASQHPLQFLRQRFPHRHRHTAIKHQPQRHHRHLAGAKHRPSQAHLGALGRTELLIQHPPVGMGAPPQQRAQRLKNLQRVGQQGQLANPQRHPSLATLQRLGHLSVIREQVVGKQPGDRVGRRLRSGWIGGEGGGQMGIGRSRGANLRLGIRAAGRDAGVGCLGLAGLVLLARFGGPDLVGVQPGELHTIKLSRKPQPVPDFAGIGGIGIGPVQPHPPIQQLVQGFVVSHFRSGA